MTRTRPSSPYARKDAYWEAPTPTEVRTVTCPYCKAEPEAHCQGVRGIRKSNHLERVRKFMAVQREGSAQT